MPSTVGLFRFFFARYFGPGEPFSMGGRDQKDVGPKKVLNFSPLCFHISGPQSARQSGTACQWKVFFRRFLLRLSGIKCSQVMSM